MILSICLPMAIYVQVHTTSLLPCKLLLWMAGDILLAYPCRCMCIKILECLWFFCWYSCGEDDATSCIYWNDMDILHQHFCTYLYYVHFSACFCRFWMRLCFWDYSVTGFATYTYVYVDVMLHHIYGEQYMYKMKNRISCIAKLYWIRDKRMSKTN